MLRTIQRRAREIERRLNTPRAYDLTDPAHRRQAVWHSHLMDHAFLRVLWTNFHKVADGVYRSNQPSPARLRRYADFGIRTVLNLRGDKPLSYYILEREACEKFGMQMVDLVLPFSAKKLPPPETLVELERLFHTLPRPFVMHCKSGADRAGFASAFYLMVMEGKTAEEADRQLHWRYVHRKTTATGVLDHFFRYYAREHARSGIALMDWVRKGYDPKAVKASFAEWQAGKWSEKS